MELDATASDPTPRTPNATASDPTPMALDATAGTPRPPNATASDYTPMALDATAGDPVRQLWLSGRVSIFCGDIAAGLEDLDSVLRLEPNHLHASQLRAR